MIKKLFEPINIGTLQLKNRIMMTAMAVLYGSDTGDVNQRQIDYYVERAKGGVGLIEVEPAEVDIRYGVWSSTAQMLRLDSDRFIPSFKELVESIHLYGAKVSIELYACGRNVEPATTGGKPPVSASAVESGRQPGLMTRALEIAEIDELVETHAEAAARAKTAGFDAVSFLGGLGYLIAQFVSPLFNKRTDEYGGSLENRLRFITRIIRRTKEKLGED